jgi:hypothetical protein
MRQPKHFLAPERITAAALAMASIAWGEAVTPDHPRAGEAIEKYAQPAAQILAALAAVETFDQARHMADLGAAVRKP